MAEENLADKYLNELKRAKADFINYQKDENRRLEEFVKFANAGLLLEFLPVLDSWAEFEKTNKDAGILAIKSQLEGILKKQGLEKITISEGQTFDPLYHESVEEIESDQPQNVILEEVLAGYALNGRVLRPSRVKISKGSKVKNL
ncbi:MAG: nucleotide exchange factor GrpE [Candidatus Harrisonbacteria bacterium]|nr:nucleotide exchange factor GrpE [Candidatus Harrisonbacteria bacterium]